jgi:hypothetical protein
MNQRPFSAALLVAVGLGALQLGCKREEAARPGPVAPLSSEARQQLLNPSLPPGHPPTDPSGAAMPNLPPPSAAEEGKALAWDLPKGWSEARAGGMRLATLKPPVPGKIDVSVIVLSGTAGGELANVNRWRGQVGLGQVDEATRMKMRKDVKSKAGTVSLYDFGGEGNAKERMLAGLLLVDGRSWFFKMSGDSEAVAAARTDFVSLLQSMHFSAED